MKVCEKKSSADTKVNEEEETEGSLGIRAEIPLQPMMQTLVRQVVPLQPMEVYSGAAIHL